MRHPIYLSYLTVFDATPPEAVEIAARAGYDRLGFRLLPAGPGDVPPPILTDAALLTETRSRLADLGMGTSDIEIARLGPDTEVARFAPFLDAAEALGARHVIVAGDDPDTTRLSDRFAALAEGCRAHGLTADLEFMPWTQVPDVATARRVVAAAQTDNVGVVVDTLHLARCGSTLAEVADLPRAWLNYAQICDGPAEGPTTEAGLIDAARNARDDPGDGGLDLVAHIQALPADVPISVEVPKRALKGHVSPEDRAGSAIRATRRVLERAGRAWGADA